MAAIGIVTLAEPGHINPTVRLRNELIELGHEVTYIVREREDVAHFADRNLPYAIVGDAPEGALLSFQPEVVLIEAIMVDAAIFAYENAIPALKISSTFSQRYEPRLPPPTCDLFPDRSAAGAAQIARAWQAEHDRILNRPWTSSCLELVREHGFPADWIDARAAIEITFRIPELTLAPRELDFERDDPDMFYAGPCVELARDESGRTPLDELDGEQPIAYCAFGTQTHRYADLPERIGLVIEAARLLPRVRFVISWEGDDFGTLPPNVVLMRKAPQLGLLRRSAVMLTHGGLNSIKEALCLGVPLVVLPFDRDQPGNAARVAYHGYGRKASWDSTPAADLAGHVAAVLEDGQLRRRVRALRDRLQSALHEKQAAEAFRRCQARCEESEPLRRPRRSAFVTD